VIFGNSSMLTWFFQLFRAKPHCATHSQEEIAYKERQWELLSGILKKANTNLTEDQWRLIKAKVMSEFDRKIDLARSAGKTAAQIDQERVDALNTQFYTHGVTPPGDDQKFAAWLNNHFKSK